MVRQHFIQLFVNIFEICLRCIILKMQLTKVTKEEIENLNSLLSLKRLASLSSR